MTAYYNEYDPFAAAWLRELIKAGLIPAGDVDERSITEVKPDDIKNYTQCHFFAGIGGWPAALRLAGWGDDRPVWTGSAPCQPFSSAGKQKGKADERHLFPAWLSLISERKPAAIFGEQVASAVAHGWLDDVYQGLEAKGYAIGTAILPACSVGAPHRRDRLWFVANSCGGRCAEQGKGEGKQPWRAETFGSGALGNAEYHGWNAGSFVTSDAKDVYLHTQRKDSSGESSGASEASDVAGISCIICPDGKQRAIKSDICLLADGVSNRVGKLRGYGNAIVPQVAAEFITAFMETQNG